MNEVPNPKPPFWKRALARIGVASVWSAGVLVTGASLVIVGTIGISRMPAGHRLTFSLANRALTSSSNLRLSAKGSLLLEHGASLSSPVLEIVDSTGARHPLLAAKNARLLTSWWDLLSRNPQEIRVELTDRAKDLLIAEGYDPMYGARPLKRTLQRQVLDKLAMQVLQGEFQEGDTVRIDAPRGDLEFIRAGQAVPA